MRSTLTSAPKVPRVWPALGAIALAALLNPLNTSMIAVALVDVRRSFGVEVSASTWLLLVFALTSAIAHPIMGRLADRFGPRRVLLGGLLVVGVGGFAAAWAPTFEILLGVRALQALGTSTAYPAGLALLQRMRREPSLGGNIPPAWLGLISACGNASAALGPPLGGALIAAWGWRAVFLLNVPVTLIGALVALLALPPDGETVPRLNRGFRQLVLLHNRSLLKVYAQMIVLCLVVFSIFFGLPLWLEQCRGLSAAQAGLIMAPLAASSALMTPFSVRMATKLGRPWVLFAGAGGLVVGTVLMLTLNEFGSAVTVGVIVALFGVPNAFSNLGLQADLTRLTRAGDLGMAGGLFQTTRFVGAGFAAALIGLIFAHGVTTPALHRLAVVVGVPSFVLLAVATRRLVRDRFNQPRVCSRQIASCDAGDLQ